MKKIKTRDLCEAAILIALQVVLSRLASFQIIGLKFGLSFIPMALAGILLGPVWAGVSYAVADFVGWLLFPTGPYMPGFTLSCAIMGICYGLFLYKKEKIRFFPEVICPTVINTCILGLLVNSFWMSLVYSSKGFKGWMLYRLPQEAGLFILHLIFLPLLCKLAKTIRKSTGR